MVTLATTGPGPDSRRSRPAASTRPQAAGPDASTCTDPPDGSSSASRARPDVAPTAVRAAATVVTPGEPFADTSTMAGTG